MTNEEKKPENAKPKLPLALEYKQGLGSLSIAIEWKMPAETRKQYVITFFFEHITTCNTYSRSIVKSELHGLFPTFQVFPGWVHKYLGSKPEIRECATMVVLIFSHPDQPAQAKLYISVPLDQPRKPIGQQFCTLGPPGGPEIASSPPEIDRVD